MLSRLGNAMDIISITLLEFSVINIIVEEYPVQRQMERQLSLYLVQKIFVFFVLFSIVVLLYVVPNF